MKINLCVSNQVWVVLEKSEVINNVRIYCKVFNNELDIEFTKRTIGITVITGSAAVSIPQRRLEKHFVFYLFYIL